MEPTVFLAYPLTMAGDLPNLSEFVSSLRRALIADGWGVSPVEDGIRRLWSPSEGRPAEGLLSSNVRGVTTSELLVVLVPTALEPSSIWVELGMALAARLPIIIVGEEGVRIPFLGRLAVSAVTGEHRGSRVLAAVPPLPSTREDVIRKVVAAADSFRS